MRPFLFLLLAGCHGVAANYTRTGPARAARAVDAPVQVFLASQPEQKFVELGVVELTGGSLDNRINRAKDIARKNGGEAVLLLDSHLKMSSHTSSDVIGTRSVGTGRTPVLISTSRTRVTSYPFERYVIIAFVTPDSERPELSEDDPPP